MFERRRVRGGGLTDPDDSRSHLGAMLLGYYTDDGRSLFAGRAGTGMTDKELPSQGAGTTADTEDALAEPPPGVTAASVAAEAVTGAANAEHDYVQVPVRNNCRSRRRLVTIPGSGGRSHFGNSSAAPAWSPPTSLR